MIMDQYQHSLKVMRGIKKKSSPEMLAYLQGLNSYEIEKLAYHQVRQSGELDNFLIERFPLEVRNLA